MENRGGKLYVGELLGRFGGWKLVGMLITLNLMWTIVGNWLGLPFGGDDWLVGGSLGMLVGRMGRILMNCLGLLLRCTYLP